MENAPLHTEFVPLALVGVLFLIAAISNAEVFYSGGRAQLFVKLIRRTGLRVLYAAVGLWALGWALHGMNPELFKLPP